MNVNTRSPTANRGRRDPRRVAWAYVALAGAGGLDVVSELDWLVLSDPRSPCSIAQPANPNANARTIAVVSQIASIIERWVITPVRLDRIERGGTSSMTQSASPEREGVAPDWGVARRAELRPTRHRS